MLVGEFTQEVLPQYHWEIHTELHQTDQVGRKEGKVDVTIIAIVTLIEKEKLIIHGLGNSCVCQTVMPKKIPTPTEKQVL